MKASPLRAETSQLAYAQQQLDAEQRQNHQRLKLTAIEVTSVGSATREVLERLQNGFDLARSDRRQDWRHDHRRRPFTANGRARGPGRAHRFADR